jgi:polyhydroxyalkanoate synthesis regulator phasin
MWWDYFRLILKNRPNKITFQDKAGRLIMNILKDSKQRIKAQLDEWREKLDEIDEQLQKSRNEENLRTRNDIKNLQEKVKELENQFEELKDKGENAWVSFKVRLDNAAGELQDGIMKAVNKLKK